METINDRISLLIDELQIKKSEFAERVHITPAFVSQICSGVRQPSDRTVSYICSEFGINEFWLRTGEGDMYKQLDRYQELSSFFGDLMMTEPDVRHRLIGAIMHADLEELRMIERFAWRWVEETKKTDP